MPTVRELLNTLPAPFKEEAFDEAKRIRKQEFPNLSLDLFFDDDSYRASYQALEAAFNWDSSTQGWKYWSDLYFDLMYKNK